MKKLYAILIALAFATNSALAFEFEDEIIIESEGNYSPTSVLAPSPLKYQVIFIGGVDEVQTVDKNGNPNGSEPAKQWHDFMGFTPDPESDDLGWISCNHEMIQANDKIGDGGGMTVFKIRREGDDIVVVDQTLPDGRTGKFFNVDFVNTVGETGMNCGGIIGPTGRIWTAEEWWRGSNSDMYLGGAGFRDTTDWKISSDLPGNFDGATIKRNENLNYMVEIDPRTAKAIRKQYNWGRQAFEGGCMLPDNKTLYLGADATPGYFSKFVADEAGDFTRGSLYVYKQNAGSFTGAWIEIDNTVLDNMINFTIRATELGATMFNRIEWLAYNDVDGKIYIAETGRDNPAGRWSDEAAAGATYAQHHIERAQQQGVAGPGDPDYWDYYGRVMVYDPSDNSCRTFLEAGPYYEGLDADNPTYVPYPDKHLSSPDGLNFIKTGGKNFMIIQEDLVGSSYGRVPLGVANRTCEIYLLDMEDEPKVSNLRRLGVVPMGAEVTGAIAIDEKTMLINSQHPWTTNKYPYNNSLTYVLSGFDKLVSVFEEDNINLEEKGFQVYPNPVSRELNLNKFTDAALYDVNGKRVKVVRNTNVFDVRDVQSGTYFIKTKDNETQKIIIE